MKYTPFPAMFFLLLLGTVLRGQEPALIPALEGEWWQVAGNPDLGPLTGEEQQPVDFAIWQSADGTWQLWSCIRFTKEEGGTRLFHRWEGESLTRPNWKPMGVAMRADPHFGENLGMMQAPYVIQKDGMYYRFYGTGDNIGLATSQDGKTFARHLQNGHSDVFVDFKHTRDIMILSVGDLYYGYFTAYPGPVYARTSRDLLAWSDPPLKVAYGGSVGKSGIAAQCPFVYYHAKAGYYYLFRTQGYGVTDPEEKFPPLTTVYRSKDPTMFGIDTDDYMVAQLPVAAPEVIEHEGETYLAALLPNLEGIRITRLKWVPKE